MQNSMDCKATNILIAKLFGAQNSTKDVDKISPSRNGKTTRSPRRRLTRNRSGSQSNKITSWLETGHNLKENNSLNKQKDSKCRQPKDAIETPKKSEPKKQKVLKKTESVKQKSCTSVKKMKEDGTVENSKIMDIKNKKCSKNKSLVKNNSFETYGVLMPSTSEIMREKEDLEDLKRELDGLGEIEDIPLDLSFSLDVSQEKAKETVLGCAHLTNKQLRKYFKKNKSYLANIITGEQCSERHDRFYNYKTSYDLTPRDLTYNTSTILFTYDQQEYLMCLLCDEFDKENKLTQYFFKVLLPEFCTKIFMDVHKMKYDDAVKYLDTRPIE